MLIAWNIVLYFWKADQPVSDIVGVVFQGGEGILATLLSYAALICNNSLHALSFFAMLNQIGAVSMGIMKGTISVCTLLLASFAYCEVDSSQCLTGLKVFCMTLVVCGSVTFAYAKVN